MSVLINMEMPTSCYDCDFAYQDQDSEHNVYWTCAAIHKLACIYKRRDDCPLISIPEHGRLIDADALADILRGFIAMYDSCPFNQSDFARRNELQSVLVEVMNAPTIIQATPQKEEI